MYISTCTSEPLEVLLHVSIPRTE